MTRITFLAGPAIILTLCWSQVFDLSARAQGDTGFHPENALLALSDLPPTDVPWTQDAADYTISPPDADGFTYAQTWYIAGEQRVFSRVSFAGFAMPAALLPIAGNAFFSAVANSDPVIMISGPAVGDNSQWAIIPSRPATPRTYVGVAFIANGLFGAVLMGRLNGETSTDPIAALAMLQAQRMSRTPLPPVPTPAPVNLTFDVTLSTPVAGPTMPIGSTSAAIPAGSYPVTLSLYQRGYCPYTGCAPENVYQDSMTGTLYFTPSNCDYPAYNTPGFVNVQTQTLVVFPAEKITCLILGVQN